MRAFALHDAEGPARLDDVPAPQIPEDGLLIRVVAASVNGFDVYMASGGLTGMIEHKFPAVVGRDFSGIVKSVGPAATGHSVGDEVFGFIPPWPTLHDGSFAELLPASAEVVVAAKPAGLGFPEAAALPLAGVQALDLVDAIDPHEGDPVLIVGATGGVGSFAVQLAARRGARVIATALSPDEEFVRRLGATDTVDYSDESVADAVRARYPEGVDSLIDVVSQKEAFAELARLVRPSGRVATSLGVADVEGLAASNVTGSNVNATPTPEKLRFLADLAGSGELQIVIQDVYPLDHVHNAIRAFQEGKRGKLVIRTALPSSDST